MSNILSHAMVELDRIGMREDSEDEMNRAMRKHILHMMNEFAEEGHSGFSASYAISILTRLMDFKPLSPLTGDEAEWHEVGDGHWQNKRRSSIFKNADGSCYDIDGRVFWEWYRDEDGKASKTYYTGGESSIPVTFPYTVPDKPIYEYRYSDAEPSQPKQNEEGFL